MRRVIIEFLTETKYLGVFLDDKLLWNSQIKRVEDRTIKALMAWGDVIGLQWGLRPAMLRRI
jgi:hypothetical protein